MSRGKLLKSTHFQFRTRVTRTKIDFNVYRALRSNPNFKIQISILLGKAGRLQQNRNINQLIEWMYLNDSNCLIMLPILFEIVMTPDSCYTTNAPFDVRITVTIIKSVDPIWRIREPYSRSLFVIYFVKCNCLTKL